MQTHTNAGVEVKARMHIAHALTYLTIPHTFNLIAVGTIKAVDAEIDARRNPFEARDDLRPTSRQRAFNQQSRHRRSRPQLSGFRGEW